MQALELIRASLVTAEAVAPQTPIDVTTLMAAAIGYTGVVPTYDDHMPVHAELKRLAFIRENADAIRLSVHTKHPIYLQSSIPGVGRATRTLPLAAIAGALNLLAVTIRWQDGTHVWPHCYKSGDGRTIIGFERNEKHGNLGRLRILQLRGARLSYAQIAAVLSNFADNFPDAKGVTRAMRVAKKSQLASEMDYAESIGNTAPVDDTQASKATIADLERHLRENNGPIQARLS